MIKLKKEVFTFSKRVDPIMVESGHLKITVVAARLGIQGRLLLYNTLSWFIEVTRQRRPFFGDSDLAKRFSRRRLRGVDDLDGKSYLARAVDRMLVDHRKVPYPQNDVVGAAFIGSQKLISRKPHGVRGRVYGL